MTDPIEQVIRNMAANSPNPAEFARRISRTLGDTQLDHAYRIAAEVNGCAWLEDKGTPQSESSKPQSTKCVYPSELGDTSNCLGVNARVVLSAGLAMLALVMLFPPYVIPLPQGFINNVGFSFIFNPPGSNELHAVVNVPLLATLIAGITVLTIGAIKLAQALGSSSS